MRLMAWAPEQQGSCLMACVRLVGLRVGTLCPEKGASHWQFLDKREAQRSVRVLVTPVGWGLGAERPPPRQARWRRPGKEQQRFEKSCPLDWL